MVVHERLGIYGNGGLRGWWAVSEHRVRALGVPMLCPSLDDDLNILEWAEDFAIKQFVPGNEEARQSIWFPPRVCTSPEIQSIGLVGALRS